MQQSSEPYRTPPDIDRIYLEMLAEYAVLEATASSSSSLPRRGSEAQLCKPNYAGSVRTANKDSLTGDRPRRTMSGSIAQFASMYGGASK